MRRERGGQREAPRERGTGVAGVRQIPKRQGHRDGKWEGGLGVDRERARGERQRRGRCREIARGEGGGADTRRGWWWCREKNGEEREGRGGGEKK